jgi:hypothetical protein
MASTLNITPPALVGGVSFIVLQMTVVTDGVTVSDQYFNFHANDFSTIYDTLSPNMAVLHLGNQHSFTMSNGDYSIINYNGSVEADVVSAVLQITGAVAVFTT